MRPIKDVFDEQIADELRAADSRVAALTEALVLAKNGRAVFFAETGWSAEEIAGVLGPETHFQVRRALTLGRSLLRSRARRVA